MEDNYKALNDPLKSMNVLDSKVLQNQEATFEEMENMANTGNNFRNEAFNAFLDLKGLTNETEWNKIMKEFNKLIR